MLDYTSNPIILNKRATLLKEVRSRDVTGSPTSLYHPVADIYVGIEYMSGREYWIASQSQGEGTIRLSMRFRSDVSDRSRFILHSDHEGDIVLEVKSPPINKENTYLEVMCRRLSDA